MANYRGSGDPWDGLPWPETSPVGYYDGCQIPSGSDMVNGYSLYDVAGNVWEWCNDWYDSGYYSSSPYDNPQGPASGTSRVLRGGAWSCNSTDYLRCACRDHYRTPGARSDDGGFRLVLVACGEGTCGPGEDSCNCPEDCGAPPVSEVLYSTCHDGLDNDCDGAADCDDLDCQRPYGDIFPCPPPNGTGPDGAVEIMDVLAVLDAAEGNPACPAWCP